LFGIDQNADQANAHNASTPAVRFQRNRCNTSATSSTASVSASG
jgi:hypothetical protein